MKKHIIYFCLCVLSLMNNANAIQIIHEQPSSSEQFWIGFGEGLAESLQDYSRKMKIQQLREEEERLEQERYRMERTRENATIERIIGNYDSARHSDSVIEIIRSDLTTDTKKMMIDLFNEHKKVYHPQKN